MTLDLDHLRRVAEAATPGPWTKEFARLYGPDKTHIAAFDPPTVLALIDRLEAAEAKVARVEEHCAFSNRRPGPWAGITTTKAVREAMEGTA